MSLPYTAPKEPLDGVYVSTKIKLVRISAVHYFSGDVATITKSQNKI